MARHPLPHGRDNSVTTSTFLALSKVRRLTLDVITENLAVTLSAALSETLSKGDDKQ